jgi:hypothetical protein
VTISSLTVGNLIPVSWKKKYLFLRYVDLKSVQGFSYVKELQELEQNCSKYLDRSFIDAQVSKFQLYRMG